MSDYRSIPCAEYDRLELAILHRERLRLRWSEGGVEHLERGQPLDLVTEKGAEFLVFRGLKGATLRVRLDRLRVLL
ncbi:MAG: transcriptional antiterminator, Rof [Acidiferrobacteraceae bacterium]